MNGKLRTLGLALVAAFALSAIAAAGASAEGAYTLESAHSTFEGTQTETAEITSAVGATKCKKVTFSGTTEAKEVTDLTITPTYSECSLTTIFGTISVTVNMNGCQYTLTTPTETGEAPPADMHAELHITCPVGKTISISGPGCSVTIPGQTPTTPTVDVSNSSTEPLEARVAPTVAGISHNYSGFTCGSGSANNGTYVGPVATKGFVAGGAPWIARKRVGGEATEGAKGQCEFTKTKQKCQIEFKNVSMNNLKVKNVKFFGTNANGRYKKVKEACTFNLALIGGEACTDEIESATYEAGTVNDYCMTVENAANGALRRICANLSM